MSKQPITTDLIMDIFNVPRDGSNIKEEDEDSYDLSGESKVSIEEKSKEFAAQMTSIPASHQTEKTTVIAEKATDIIEKSVEKEKEKVIEIQKKDDVETAVKDVMKHKMFSDIFDDDEVVKKVETPVTEKVKTPVTEKVKTPVTEKEIPQPVKEVKVAPKPEVELEEKPAESDTKAQSQSVPWSDPPLTELRIVGGHRWKLYSPSEKYAKLYEDKRELLAIELMRGGEIPFNKYYDELKNASVDTNVSTYDAEEVGRRITEVMRWRDRIKQIVLHVNSQYFVWKCEVDLLTGTLARIEYERGKQEGIIYEHLNDFCTYLGHLEGLVKSCDAVAKHLDGAYASLSRQIAIAQPFLEVERCTSNGSKPMTTQLQRFDSLTNANKSGAVASARTKEAGNPAKPQQGWGIAE